MVYSYNDISLYYERYGTKEKSIVILPGWGETRSSFDFLVTSLSSFASVYILDYPGFGKTPFPNRTLSIYDYADMIHSWITDCHLEDAVFLGHSFGGRILILLSGYYHYPYKNFIFMDSAGILPKRTFLKKCRSFCYRFLKKMGMFFPKKMRKKYLNFLFQKFASQDYLALPCSMRKTFQNIVNTDLSFFLKEIKARVLLLWGEKDEATCLSDGIKMRKEIPNSELIVLQNLGHFPYLERPWLVYSILYAHLKEIGFVQEEKNDRT